MARRGNIHTVYHSMEEKGYFEKNPANVDSRDQVTGESIFKGPVQYPKMFYHPLGAERIRVPAEIVATLMGPQRVGEKREIICQVAQDEAQGAALVAQGWWDHPAKAIRARLRAENLDQSLAPEMGSDEKIIDLQAQIAKLQADKADMEATLLAQSRASGGIVPAKSKAGPSPGPASGTPA